MRIGPQRQVSWPRRPPPLTEAQQRAREQFLQLWEEQLPTRYKMVEQFNHGWVARLPHPHRCRTLEVGAGLESHLAYQRLADQDYHCLEMRGSFCAALRQKLEHSKVHRADIQRSTGLPGASWDRIVAIHMLEHLPDLPSALREIKRLLTPDGISDLVIPCDGGVSHTIARKISAQRLFENTFRMSFAPIIQNEHVSHFPDVTLLQQEFDLVRYRFPPSFVPLYHLNLAAAFRMRSKTRTRD